MADAISRSPPASASASSRCNTGRARRTPSAAWLRRSATRCPIVVLPVGYPRRSRTRARTSTRSSTSSTSPNRSSRSSLAGVGARTRCGAPSPRSRTADRARPWSRSRPTCCTRRSPADSTTADAAPALGPDPRAMSERRRRRSSAAERPVIYAGQGVHYAEAWPQLRELAELLEAPVTTSLQGKSAFPENHPLSLGSGGRVDPQAGAPLPPERGRHLRHRLQLHRDRTTASRCRRARRSSTRRSTRPTSTRTCRPTIAARRRRRADAGRAARRGAGSAQGQPRGRRDASPRRSPS